MNTGVHHPYHLYLCADDEDPSQLIIRPGWDAPDVRGFPRVFYAWPCLLRQVGTSLGSPYDCVVTGITYANPGYHHQSSPKDKFLVNIINPYLAEVKRHPQTLWVGDGVLHKEDLKGLVKDGSTKARLEEVEQEFYKYKKMIEHGVEAKIDIIAEMKAQHDKKMKEVWSSMDALETDAREISFSFLVGYPKWKVRCSTATVSLSEDAKVDCLP